MKRVLMVLLIAVMLVAAAGCGGGTKTLHCDNCQKEVKVDKKSNMTEEWTVYCAECNKALGIDESLKLE